MLCGIVQPHHFLFISQLVPFWLIFYFASKISKWPLWFHCSLYNHSDGFCFPSPRQREAQIFRPFALPNRRPCTWVQEPIPERKGSSGPVDEVVMGMSRQSDVSWITRSLLTNRALHGLHCSSSTTSCKCWAFHCCSSARAPHSAFLPAYFYLAYKMCLGCHLLKEEFCVPRLLSSWI